MFNIAGYLEKFKIIGGESRNMRSVCAEVCSNISGIDISAKDISYKNGLFRIKAPSMVKNVLFMKKDLIIKEIRSKNTAGYAVDDLLF